MSAAMVLSTASSNATSPSATAKEARAAAAPLDARSNAHTARSRAERQSTTPNASF